MNSFIKKLSIGTAQFGLPYGVANNSGKIDLSESSVILSTALSRGVNGLDTAIAYGDSEEILGKIGVSCWQVTTKLPRIPENCVDVDRWVKRNIENSIRNLRVNRLHAVLLHHPQDFCGPHRFELAKSLNEVKSKNSIAKIGVSIYHPDQLEYLLKLHSIDVVQVPLNILDQRIVNSGWLKKLKKLGIEVQARSIFLQGLLLMPQAMRPAKFSSWNEVWDLWDDWLLNNDIKPIEACLKYINSIVDVDRIIIGVDSIRHLTEILNTNTDSVPKLPEWPKFSDLRIIDPTTWAQI